MWARIRAQGWLGLYDGRTFQNPMPPMGNDNGQGGARTTPGEESEDALVVDGYAVYPNPASDVLAVRYPVAEGDQPVFEISDLTGRKVMHIRLDPKAGEQRIDVAALRSGIYVWRITGSNGELAHGKWTKL